MKQNLTQINQQQKIILIRHAQSLTNKAVHDFQRQKNLPQYCWNTFRSFQDFYHRVIYNPDLCDCGISQNGQQNCLQAKQNFKNIQIDLILVSPLQRALQTCERIFSDRFDNVKVIVQPLLAQSMKYSSDVSRQISQKQKSYPFYDFTNVKKQGDFWFIKNDNEQNQKLYFQHLQVYPHYTYKEKQKQITKFMYKRHLRESNQNVRNRVRKIKQLLKDYSKLYKNIVVVSHYYTIKHLLANKVSKIGQPLIDFHGPNCGIHQQTLGNLLKNPEIQ